jgi:hypothetical protein
MVVYLKMEAACLLKILVPACHNQEHPSRHESSKRRENYDVFIINKNVRG